MKTKIQIRRDTAANWASNNPILSAGEFGLESDTQKIKVGNGLANWATRPYINVLPSDLAELSQDAVNNAVPKWELKDYIDAIIKMDNRKNPYADLTNEEITPKERKVYFYNLAELPDNFKKIKDLPAFKNL